MLRILCFIFFLIPIQELLAQGIIPGDHNLDQVPREMLSRFKPSSSSTSVITIENWDNFNLGIDMAESNIASNPNQPSWFFTAFNINETHHTENGLEWNSNNPDFGAEVRGDPVVTYDSLGNLYYLNMIGWPDVTGARAVKSADNGITWEAAIDAVEGYDKCWLACDQTQGPYANFVYATMSGINGGIFSRSTDQGNHFQTTFQPSTQSLPGMMVCVGAYNHVQGGAVYVVTNSGNSFASTYTFYRSLDGGASFTLMSEQHFAGYVGTNVGERNSVENMRTRPYPYITADNSYGTFRGRLYLVYASNNPSGDGNKPDIFCRYSDNGGVQWSEAVIVNDDPASEFHHQWHPATWCDKETGRLYIQWMDTRDTPSGDSAFIYAAYSDDGGQTFVANQRISNQKMKIDCSTCGGGGTPRYQGDYNGIVSNRKVSMVSWTDFRDGSLMSTAAYFPDFAMKLDHTIDTLHLKNDTVRFLVIVPETKLYTDVLLISAEISPIPANGSITVFYPQSNSMCTIPDTVAVDIILSGSVPTGDYTATFFARGPNRTPVHSRNAIINVAHGNSYYVYPTATPDTLCSGASSQLMAHINGGMPPFTYSWFPSTGLSDPNIANPIASPTTSIRYHISATDALSNTDTDSIGLIVKLPPTIPGEISGEQTVCINSNALYSVSPSEEVTSYSWTVPSGAAILSGQNTPEILVAWGSNPGNISVIVGNDCGTSNPRVLWVEVTPGPEIPGNIYGPDHTCMYQNITFFVDEAPGANSYQWIVPAGVQILQGQGTPSIDVSWGNAEGEIFVFPLNDCGEGDTLNKILSLDPLPSPALTISGKDSVCLNHMNYLYSVQKLSYATTYVWQTPPGAEIITGEETNEVMIFFSPEAISGNIRVAGENDCGQGMGAEMFITVSPCAGISPETKATGLRLFPNPAANLVNIELSGNKEISDVMIMDLKGRILIRKSHIFNSVGGSCRIELTEIPKGLYLVEVISADAVYYSKMMIEK